MQVRIDSTPDETVRACHAISSASATQPSATVLRVVAAVGVTVGVVFVYGRSPAVTLGVLGGFMGGMLAFLALYRAEVRRLITSDPHTREPHHIDLNADGLRAWCDHADSRYTWNSVRRVIENDEFYLFIRYAGTGLAIPKRILDTTQDQELRASVRAWAPDRGTSLNSDAQIIAPPPNGR